jgi:hypothetical protein
MIHLVIHSLFAETKKVMKCSIGTKDLYFQIHIVCLACSKKGVCCVMEWLKQFEYLGWCNLFCKIFEICSAFIGRMNWCQKLWGQSWNFLKIFGGYWHRVGTGLSTGPPGYIGWRNRCLGSIPGLHKRLKIRAQISCLCTFMIPLMASLLYQGWGHENPSINESKI